MFFNFFSSSEQTPQRVERASGVQGALQAASQKTGVGFDYLLKTATRESGLNPTAKASTSSASGLFQFIDSTWLETVKEEGAKFGLGAFADKIRKTVDGRYRVEGAARQEVMALRHNPDVAAVMAAAYTQRNAAVLQKNLGRPVSDGELYAAHFMGAQGASELIEIATQTPNANAARAFPDQAAANRSIFYSKDGKPKSVSEVLASLTRDFNSQPSPVAVAAANPLTPDLQEKFNLFDGGKNAFHGLFGGKTPDISSASGATVSQRSTLNTRVADLWRGAGGQGALIGAAPAAKTHTAPPSVGKPLDLLQFIKPTVSPNRTPSSGVG